MPMRFSRRLVAERLSLIPPRRVRCVFRTLYPLAEGSCPLFPFAIVGGILRSRALAKVPFAIAFRTEF